MDDSLFRRSANTIKQSRSLREERQMLMEQHKIAVDQLRQTVAECAMTCRRSRPIAKTGAAPLMHAFAHAWVPNRTLKGNIALPYSDVG
jgi:hypothetical protein